MRIGVWSQVMQIEPLANYPEAIPTLARWFNEEWPYENRSLDARETQLRENLNRDRSPITWVARWLTPSIFIRFI